MAISWTSFPNCSFRETKSVSDRSSKSTPTRAPVCTYASTRPACVSRDPFLSAATSPRDFNTSRARFRSPFASVSARLIIIIEAPVSSRSSLIVAALISIIPCILCLYTTGICFFGAFENKPDTLACIIITRDWVRNCGGITVRIEKRYNRYLLLRCLAKSAHLFICIHHKQRVGHAVKPHQPLKCARQPLNLALYFEPFLFSIFFKLSRFRF